MIAKLQKRFVRIAMLSVLLVMLGGHIRALLCRART